MSKWVVMIWPGQNEDGKFVEVSEFRQNGFKGDKNWYSVSEGTPWFIPEAEIDYKEYEANLHISFNEQLNADLYAKGALKFIELFGKYLKGSAP